MPRKFQATPVMATCLIDGLVAFGAPLWNYYWTRADVVLQAGAGLIAATTFLGVWIAQRERLGTERASEAMRDAIAASFVLTYLIAVGWSAFFNYIATGPTGALSPLTASLITNFTALTGIVVGSYFGLSAVQQVVQGRSRAQAGQLGPLSSGGGARAATSPREPEGPVAGEGPSAGEGSRTGDTEGRGAGEVNFRSQTRAGE